jgi:hypothetical protein
MWVCPLAVGTAAQIAGRSIPGIIFMTNLEIAISAPVLPAETQASASPFLTRFTATRIDESFLLRKAREGDSCISTTSEAWTTRSRELAADFPSSGCSDSSRPTRIRLAAGWASRKRRDAGTVTDGPWSPPMQSMAMRAVMAKGRRPGTNRLPFIQRSLALGLEHLLAAINAIRRDMVAQMHFAGRRLDGQRRIGQEVVSAMHATLGRGFLVLLNSHVSTPKKSVRLASEAGQPGERMNPLAGIGRARQTTSFMPWRNRHDQEDFVLHQLGHIQSARHRQEIARVVFQLVLRHLGVLCKKFQKIVDMEIEGNGFQATLTGQRERSRNRHVQQRLAALSRQPPDVEAHLSSNLRQQVMQAIKARKFQRSFKDAAFRENANASEILFNLRLLRLKPAMILFLARQVKT